MAAADASPVVGRVDSESAAHNAGINRGGFAARIISWTRSLVGKCSNRSGSIIANRAVAQSRAGPDAPDAIEDNSSVLCSGVGKKASCWREFIVFWKES